MIYETRSGDSSARLCYCGYHGIGISQSTSMTGANIGFI